MITTILTETISAVTGTTIGGVMRNLDRFDAVLVHGTFTGGENATIDITLQRRISNTADGAELWSDWARFAQLASTAAQVSISLSSKGTPTTSTITAVAIDTAGAASPVIAAGDFLGSHPGDALRAVYTVGTGIESGTPITWYVSGVGERR